MSKRCWKKCANRLVSHRVATNLQFVKNAILAKLDKMKHKKRKYVCIGFCSSFTIALK